VLKALSDGAVEASEEGGRKRRMPLAIPALQKPHPPLWYGIHSPEAADRAAKQGMNLIGLDTVAELKPCFERFKSAWVSLRANEPLPKMGIGRFVFVAREREDAIAAARRAYRRWHASFVYLSTTMGWSHRHSRPAEFDAIAADGRAIAGTPDDVAQAIGAQLARTGANYFVGQFAFGDLTQEETLTSIGLFASEVAPKLGDTLRPS
jgi:alkanesulfonate monooxygenase SsuD/methylene tetrahydromethanopterin reductase-like flavin-dependent oxidoreductase (luciferase family)